MNTVTFPDRNLIPLINYKSYRDARIETKRGCIFRLYILHIRLEWQELRLRKPTKVVDEIEILVKNRGVERFTFVDGVLIYRMTMQKDMQRNNQTLLKGKLVSMVQ